MPCIQRDEGSSQCLCHDPFGGLMKPVETLSEKCFLVHKKKIHRITKETNYTEIQNNSILQSLGYGMVFNT